MKILIIGNGGREHALAWKCAQSTQVETVFVAPGNAGTALEDKVENVNLKATDIADLLHFAQTQSIDLTIVGPEAPLAAGIVDEFQKAQLPCFGPTQAAAQLESSKAFCKKFMQRHQIPTAHYQTFTDLTSAKDYLLSQTMPIVIKADGLAAGKGVVIAQTLEEANQALDDMLAKQRFGIASQEVVIEDFLGGEEASFIAMVDGEYILPLASSQDHKSRDDGDLGPNTGGMGAYSPAPVVTNEIQQRIMKEIMEPTVKAMAAEGQPFVGFLYAGLMINDKGEPMVLEFNCRLGDPETQCLLIRLQSDLVALCTLALAHKLDSATIEWDPRPGLGVVLAAGGYPNHYQQGDEIHGLEQHLDSKDYKVFHAGTKKIHDKTVTAGGRVLCVTALAEDFAKAQAKAYQLVQTIHWPNMYYRKDIGKKAITVKG